MSSQAQVDPERLRNFSIELNRYASKIDELDKDLQNALVHLGETFRDEHYQEFRSRFIASRQKLEGFTNEIRSVTPRMVQDADDIAAAQRVRLDL